MEIAPVALAVGLKQRLAIENTHQKIVRRSHHQHQRENRPEKKSGRGDTEVGDCTVTLARSTNRPVVGVRKKLIPSGHQFIIIAQQLQLRSEHLSKQSFVAGYHVISCIVIEDALAGGHAHAGSQFRVVEKTNEAACDFL